MSNRLPTGWIQTTLSDVFTFSGGGTPGKNNPLFWGGDIPWVSVKDIKEKYLYRSIDSITQDGVDNSATQIAKQDTVILITRISPGKTTILKIPAAINQDLKIINRFQDITAEFVHYLFLSLEKEIVNRSSGTTVLGVNLNQLGSIGFTLPPLNEQNRIVGKIEELFSELDAGVENLTKAKEQLGVYRQSLLKHAFEGKLTEEWRKVNADKLESGEALLERVKKEREEYFKKQIDQWEKDVAKWEANGKPGKKPTKLKKPNKPAPISDEELRELPELPEGWTWGRPDEVVALEPHSVGIGPFGSNLKVSDYREQGVPLVFVKNITRKDFDLDLRFVSKHKADELSTHSTKGNDILITKMGDPPGDATLYPEGRPDAIITADCIKFRVHDPDFNRLFFSFCINSPLTRKQIDKHVIGVAQKKISTETFRKLWFPIPSLQEQDQIAQTLKAKIESLESTSQEIEHQLSQTANIRRSILQKAFSGELVSQDSNDEPASKLLDRIKLEKKNAPKSTRNSKQKMKKKRVTMADLKEVLITAKDWISAQDAFRQCGVGDGAPTDEVEKLYDELKQEVGQKIIEVERRGDEDWLRLAAEG